MACCFQPNMSENVVNTMKFRLIVEMESCIYNEIPFDCKNGKL